MRSGPAPQRKPGAKERVLQCLQDIMHVLGSRPVALLCLGYMPEFYERPMPEQTEWAHRFDIKDLVKTDYWSERADTAAPDCPEDSAHRS
jgi:hypothetical protein